MRLQEVRESALALPRRSREKLAQDLANSLLDDKQHELLKVRSTYKSLPGAEKSEAEWKAEIKKRMDSHERGEAKVVSGEKVMTWLRKRMK